MIITEVDRLGRNKQETLKELQYYRDNGIRVKILELPTTLMDLSKLDNAMARMLMETINNMLIELYAAMAQAEIEKKEKRQREGIDAKKNRGEWDDYGRPAIMSQEEFAKQYKKVLSGELRPFELMKQLGIECFRDFYLDDGSRLYFCKFSNWTKAANRNGEIIITCS